MNKEIEVSAKLRRPTLFEKSSFIDDWNRSQPMYLMNRDGFSLLAMGFTGKEALQWKLKYIEAFNAMEEKLHSPQQLPDNRLEIARLIASSSSDTVDCIKALYPEYFAHTPTVDSLEYRSDVNTGYKQWLEDMNVTKSWIAEFPTKDIFLSYANYCKDNNIMQMGKKIFYKTLENDYGLTRKQKTDGYRYFI